LQLKKLLKQDMAATVEEKIEVHVIKQGWIKKES